MRPREHAALPRLRQGRDNGRLRPFRPGPEEETPVLRVSQISILFPYPGSNAKSINFDCPRL